METVKEVTKKPVYISQVKTTEIVVDLDQYPIVALKSVFESLSFSERFRKYSPMVVLKGFFEEGGNFVVMRNCTLMHVPSTAKSVKFVVLLEGDVDGNVTQNLTKALIKSLSQ